MKDLRVIILDNEHAGTIKAKRLVRVHGASLVGKQVVTPAIGDYPGGKSIVMEVAPDPNAPEIVFTVKHPTFGECGVFDYEMVRLAE